MPTDDGRRLRQAIGSVLRDERRRQERTLTDVAAAAAVSVPYLSEVERARKDVSSDLLAAIGDALDLPLATVLERSAERVRTSAAHARASGAVATVISLPRRGVQARALAA